MAISTIAKPRASASPKSELRQRMSRSWEVLRWRGPLVFLLLAFREVLSPVFYWHAWHIFEDDIRLPHPETGGKFRVLIYDGAQCDVGLREEIVAMGELTSAEVDERFRRGDAIAMAYAEGRAVGYSWICFSDEIELAFGTQWIVRPKEAVFHGSFTLPEWRGQRIHSVLDAGMCRHALGRGIRRKLACIGVFNLSSLNLMKRTGDRRTMAVILIRLRGTNRVYGKAIGKRLESRFHMPA